MQGEAEAFRRLDGHAARRRAGIPTVSLLRGPPALGRRVIERWVVSRGAARSSGDGIESTEGVVGSAGIVAFDLDRPIEEGLRAWLDAVSPTRLLEVACAAAARRTGRSIEEIRGSLACKSAHERAVWMDDVFPAGATPEDALCRALLGGVGRGVPLSELLGKGEGNGDGGRGDGDGGHGDGDGGRGDGDGGRGNGVGLSAALRALFPLCPELEHTILFGGSGVTNSLYSESLTSSFEPRRDVDERLAALVSLACAVPALPIAIAAPPSPAWDWLVAPPRTFGVPGSGSTGRALSILSEGIVEIPALDSNGIVDRLRSAGAPEVPASAIACLARDGASPELVDLLVLAASASVVAAPDTQPTEARFPSPSPSPSPSPPPSPSSCPPPDRARSAAERFLFERLASLPATAGLFELNGRVRGEASWEVDLLARGPKIAIEVDGYFHFRDADAYRVDRRKDLFLQQQGYLVLRFLAGDVVSRLPEILSAITGALASRPHRAMKEAAT